MSSLSVGLPGFWGLRARPPICVPHSSIRSRRAAKPAGVLYRVRTGDCRVIELIDDSSERHFALYAAASLSIRTVIARGASLAVASAA